MDRSISPPLHLRVSRKTPVHLHVTEQKKRRSRLEIQEKSCSAMSAGHPGLRGTCCSRSPSRSTRSLMKTHDNAATWISPAMTSKSTMTWEGYTHRLDLHPDPSDSTVLHLSDLTDENEESGIPEIVINSVADEYQRKIESLQAKMDGLKTKVELEKSIRELEQKDSAQKLTHADLKKKKDELSAYIDELADSELENRKHKKISLSRQTSPTRSFRLDYDESQKREAMLHQLTRVDKEGAILMQHAHKLKSSLKKLQKDRRFVSVHASQLLENKDIFLESLEQFESMNKKLRKMIRDHQVHQAGLAQAQEHRDLLQQKLVQSEGTNRLLREQLEEQGKLLGYSQQLHDELGAKEGEIQTISIRLQSMEEQLHEKQMECNCLQGHLEKGTEQWNREKDNLKRTNKQLKERLAEMELSMACLTQNLKNSNAELVQEKAKLAKIELTHHKEESTLKSQLLDLEASLDQSRMAGKASLETMAVQLTEKTHALNNCHCEMDKLLSLVSTLENRVDKAENSHLSKVSGLESEMLRLKDRLTHYENMLNEYRTQLSRTRAEKDELLDEVHRKEHGFDHFKNNSIIEAEKYRIKLQQQMAELEHIPELLKTSERQVSDAQERMVKMEQRNAEQSRAIIELREKLDQQTTTIGILKERQQSVMATKQTLEMHLAEAEQRQNESEEQTRELMEISKRKEDVVQRLQARVEELVEEIATVSGQLETTRANARRNLEQAKDRAIGKERTHLSRITDLEMELAKVSNISLQYRKSKDDLDRRYHLHVHELTDRLDQAQSTKRSLENYIAGLKTSYASVFKDSGGRSYFPSYINKSGL